MRFYFRIFSSNFLSSEDFEFFNKFSFFHGSALDIYIGIWGATMNSHLYEVSTMSQPSSSSLRMEALPGPTSVGVIEIEAERAQTRNLTEMPVIYSKGFGRALLLGSNTAMYLYTAGLSFPDLLSRGYRSSDWKFYRPASKKEMDEFNDPRLVPWWISLGHGLGYSSPLLASLRHCRDLFVLGIQEYDWVESEEARIQFAQHWAVSMAISALTGGGNAHFTVKNEHLIVTPGMLPNGLLPLNEIMEVALATSFEPKVTCEQTSGGN